MPKKPPKAFRITLRLRGGDAKVIVTVSAELMTAAEAVTYATTVAVKQYRGTDRTSWILKDCQFRTW